MHCCGKYLPACKLAVSIDEARQNTKCDYCPCASSTLETAKVSCDVTATGATHVGNPQTHSAMHQHMHRDTNWPSNEPSKCSIRLPLAFNLDVHRESHEPLCDKQSAQPLALGICVAREGAWASGVPMREMDVHDMCLLCCVKAWSF